MSDAASAEPQLTVIAIDGPAGSGKSTVGKRLAAELGLEYLDTGAMYRAVAFAALRLGVDPGDEAVATRIAQQMPIHVGVDAILVDGVEAGIEIRGPEVSRAVPLIAANPAVRKELIRQQREWAESRGGGVLEGRDIGSVVFPYAGLKVHLTASREVRAERLSREVSELGYETAAVERARREALISDADAPIADIAEGAVEIDTTGRSIDEIVAAIVALLP